MSRIDDKLISTTLRLGALGVWTWMCLALGVGWFNIVVTDVWSFLYVVAVTFGVWGLGWVTYKLTQPEEP